MKVAVTGSHGYIGSVLSKMLHERGDRVYGCDIAAPGTANKSNYFTIQNCSFDEPWYLQSIIDNDVRVIVHLAATSTVGPDATDPLSYFHNNAARTITFLKNLADSGWDGHFIFASTAAVYDVSDQPCSEHDMCTALNNYGMSKLLAEEAVDAGWVHGITPTIFRFFNVAGALDDVGEEHEDTHLLSRICQATIDRSPVRVYGTDYPTVDGTCVRDYVDVRDICRAIMYSIDEKIYGTYNLGTKHGTSVLQMINAFETYTDQYVIVEADLRRAGDSPFLVADPHRFTEYGFEYKYQLKDIITSSWDYFKRLNNGI